METWGGLIIWDLWDRHNYSIIDVKLGDADAYTYRFEPIAVHLDQWDKIKKYKHINNFHDQQKHFSLFVLSIYGMLGRESLVVLASLSQLMAEKMDEPILHM